MNVQTRYFKETLLELESHSFKALDVSVDTRQRTKNVTYPKYPWPLSKWRMPTQTIGVVLGPPEVMVRIRRVDPFAMFLGVMKEKKQDIRLPGLHLQGCLIASHRTVLLQPPPGDPYDCILMVDNMLVSAIS